MMPDSMPAADTYAEEERTYENKLLILTCITLLCT